MKRKTKKTSSILVIKGVRKKGRYDVVVVKGKGMYSRKRRTRRK